MRKNLVWTFLAIVLVALTSPAVALGQSASPPAPVTQPGTVDPSIGVPETSGESQSEQLATTSVDPSTGLLTTSIAIKSPKARGLAQPGISLQYSSEAGVGYAGWAWSLGGLPSIQRQPLSGPPAFDLPPNPTTATWQPGDQYFYGQKRLAPICTISGSTCGTTGETFPTVFGSASTAGWWYFREAEDSSHDRFFLSPDEQTWVIQQSSGVTLVLGLPRLPFNLSPQLPTAIETVATPTTTPAIPYRWNIVAKYDAHVSGGEAENVVLYGWTTFNGQRGYLTDVFDTPITSRDVETLSAFAHHIHFNYEMTANTMWSGFKPPIWRAVPFDFISSIDVTSDTFIGSAERELVRRYHLAYQVVGNRDYLQSVTLEGECTNPTTGQIVQVFEDGTTGLLPAVTNCTERPATTFTWSGSSTGAVTWSPTMFTSPVPAKAYVVDMNSDGLPDFVQPATSSSTGGLVEINKSAFGSGTLGSPLSVSIDTPASGMTAQNFFPDPKATTFDFTGGSFVGNALISAGWFPTKPNTSPAIWPFTAYSPALLPSGWQWQEQAETDVATYASYGPPECSAAGINGNGFGISVSAETPAGTADVDGDGYPDLITYTTYVACGSECVSYNPDGGQCSQSNGGTSEFVGVGLLSTKKNLDGTITPFAIRHGNVAPSGTFAGGSITWPTAPASARFMQYIQAASLSGAHLAPEDFNGDGLTDLAIITGSSITVGYGDGDGTLSFTYSPSSGTTDANTLLVPGLTIKDATQIYFHDINGDGLADILQLQSTGIEYFLNIDGFHFLSGVLVTGSSVPNWNQTNARISFGDMNGSGVDDVVVVEDNQSGDNAYYVDLLGGTRPGLITSISNGLGALTNVVYASTPQLDGEAAASGNPWQRHSPQVLHHVTVLVTGNVGSFDALAGIDSTDGAYFYEALTQYTYTDPFYDPRDQSFIGFRQVQAEQMGAGDDPTGSTLTTYLSGVCAIDLGTGCPAASADRPYLPLRGAPVVVDTFDGNGNYLSTAHTTYTAQWMMAAADGTNVRSLLPTQVDSYVYSSTGTTSTVAFTDVTISDLNTSVPRTVTLHGTASVLEKTKAYDANANIKTTIDKGVLNYDQPIEVDTTWSLPPGDITGWLWRKQTETLKAITSQGVFADQPRSSTFGYSARGDLQTVQVALTGNVALNRRDALGRKTASPPGDASVGNGALVETTNYTYDLFGNRITSIGPNGVSCEKTTYDVLYHQFPIADYVYTTTPASCSGAALTTSAAYNRGLEVATLNTAADVSYTTTSYDGFGRATQLFKSDPVTPALTDQLAAVITTYSDTPVESVQTQTYDGTAYRTSWTAYDGLGAKLVTVSQAASSDVASGTWIVLGAQVRGARGDVTDVYEPYFLASFNPASLVLPQPTSASRHTAYDGFGRVVSTKNYKGVQDSATTYSGMFASAYDALHLPGSANPQATVTQKDGHGRVFSVTSSGKIGTSTTVTTVHTVYQYSATGNILSIARGAAGWKNFIQNMAYDSLGHMVENQEPNTTTGSNDWRYVYNDSGELVGTSDPRGCGVNYAYDAVGREVSEDYSECETQHVAYTEPQASGAGLETLYIYDAPLGSTASSPDGRLYGVIDRAAETTVGYDLRGRPTSVNRILAQPGTPNDDWHSRFSGSAFSYAVSYDLADRVTQQGTGAVALQVGGQSVVATTYDERGNLSALNSTYGNLIFATQFDADGLPLKSVYGDYAHTTATRDYTPLRQLWHSTVTRGSLLSSASPSNDESQLEAKIFTYDAMSNPVAIVDDSTAAWPAGAKPMARYVNYDDFYHVTGVNDDFTGGSDSFTQPYAAEYAGQAPGVPLPATVLSTRVAWQAYNYDWRGNMIFSDDDQHAFYDRSLGTITNDATYPNRIDSAVGTTTNDNLSVQYDGQGDVISIGSSRSKTCTSSCTGQSIGYQWDELGHLSGASVTQKVGSLFVKTAAVTYAYDASGRRVLKSVTSGGTTNYTAEIFPSLRLNNAAWNGSTYQDDVTTETLYLAGPGGAVARVVSSTTDPQAAATSIDDVHVLFELTDALGSTSFVVDNQTSELVEAATYQPYGAPESDLRFPRWDNFREDYKFSGKEDDIDVGVTYFGGRYYSSALNRWMSADPVAVQTHKGDLNVYSYVSGRVFFTTDPTGLDPWSYTIPVDTDTPQAYTIEGGGAAQDPAQMYQQIALVDYFAQNTVGAFTNGLVSGTANGLAMGIPGALGMGPTSPYGVAGFKVGTMFGTAVGTLLTAGADGVAGAASAETSFAASATSDVAAMSADMTAMTRTTESALATGSDLGMSASAGLPTESVQGAVGAAEEVGLAGRAAQVHGALDPIAQGMRTTAALDTSAGRIIAGGARDLSPAQRAVLLPGEIAGKLPGAHAEITALGKAAELGATPQSLAVTRTICPQCAAAIEGSGGVLTSPTTAVWPQ